MTPVRNSTQAARSGALAAALLIGTTAGCGITASADNENSIADQSGEVGQERSNVRSPAAPAATTSPLQQSYENWKQDHGYEDGNRDLVLALGWSKGLSSVRTTAQGIIDISRERGLVSVEVTDATRQLGDVWLVDNQPGEKRSAMPEAGDTFIKVGSLKFGDRDSAVLEVELGERLPASFDVDVVVVTAPDADPSSDGLLFGIPSLFQRMATGSVRSPQAEAGISQVNELDALIALGERLFVEETFEGNGRTCATCHPASNNFTIDADFISRLPDDDALFVAEFTPALAENFENPVLMRQFGLIVENVDGLDDLENKFTMRSVPHTFAQAVSITPSVIDGSTQPPFERTGWSGDGAPGGGTLREFSIGAVVQHAPKTLARQAGSDFRLPTDEELDAMEAFMLSLGRQQDFDLAAMTFLDERAAAGVGLFNGAGACAACHANAGANISFGPNPFIENANFDTGVENFPHPAEGTGELRPRDSGFGQEPNPNGGFGNGSFNTSSLVEAADTPPFFHNNIVNTIEEAVAFYNSDAFNNSPSGQAIGGISLNDQEVDQVAALLRVINSVDNLDRTIEKLEQIHPQATTLARQTLCVDIVDTRGVLRDGSLHRDVRQVLRGALSICREIKDELRGRDYDGGEKIAYLASIALEKVRFAQSLMVAFE